MLTRLAFSIDDFCKIYGISRATAYREMKAGRLKYHKLGRRSRRIGKENADNWFDNLKSSDDDDPPADTTSRAP